MKRNEGFTLIELLVTISVGALVTFAAVSLLLLGARVQYNTTQEANEQQTVRIVMSLLENMAGSGAVQKIEGTDTGWQLKDQEGDVLFEYRAETQSVYRGLADTEGNAPLLSGLNNAGVVMEGDVMRLSFETDRGANYVARVYCRLGVEDTPIMTGDEVEEKAEQQKPNPEEADPAKVNRWEFLETLAGEYKNGTNIGQIGGDGAYYSQWYIGDGWGTNGWNKDTPWCACFVSWAADQIGINGFKFANVDAGMAAFEDANRWYRASMHTPTPGDYIFFDWSGEQKDPAHVGVVLDVAAEDGRTYVYTIEGNSSGRVAVRKYSINDSVIMGYGVLPGF